METEKVKLEIILFQMETDNIIKLEVFVGYFISYKLVGIPDYIKKRMLKFGELVST